MKPIIETNLFSLRDMKTLKKYWFSTALNGRLRFIIPGSLLLALALHAASVATAADTGKTFATPQEAVSALERARVNVNVLP